MLKGGVTWKEFAELAKQSYVEVASKDYGINGRPTNASRVAILTGLSRREVKRVRDDLASESPEAAPPQSKIARILSGWFQDPEFLDATGQPLELPLAGSPPNFDTLLDRYAGDLPPVATTKELKRLGLVEETGDGCLRVLRRSYTGSAMDPDILRQMATALHDHGETIAWNVNAEREGPARFERMAFNANMPPQAVAAFQRLIAERGQEFLEQMDAWLSEHERGDRRRAGQAKVKLGVGMYLVFDEQDRGKDK
jgi:hypothetical protein